jgi:hypothetical protein
MLSQLLKQQQGTELSGYAPGHITAKCQLWILIESD